MNIYLGREKFLNIPVFGQRKIEIRNIIHNKIINGGTHQIVLVT